MPTPRAHGGAPLIPINLVAPGNSGLNTEAESTLLGPEWATILTNVTFDSAGRAGLRKGWKTGTTTPVTGIVRRIFEFIKADATVETIFSTDADIFSDIVAPSSIEGTLAISEGNIKFVNFNDKCIALGTGTSSNPSVYTGSGNFTTITVNSGTAPTSGIGTAAYGRLWVVDTDGHTIRYCKLLDETRWAVADGGGTVDMAQVWPNGQDIIVAIEAFAGDLVIFGKNQIVIWTDGQGSQLGIDPLVMYVSDTIPGVGAVSQFSITHAIGDLWFTTSSGLQNLNRAMQNKTTPTNNISRHVKSKFLTFLDASTQDDDMSLVYSPREEFILAIFPDSDKVISFDTRGQLEDGTFRSSEWSTNLQTAHYFVDRTLQGSLTGTVGEILKHEGNDDDGASYQYSYESGWLDLGQELSSVLKFVKKMTTFVFIGADTDITFTLKYDFQSTGHTAKISAEATTGAEFNISEFSDSGAGIGFKDPNNTVLGESEFSGGISLQALPAPGGGGGQYIKVGINLDNAKSSFALQQINLYAKIGRMAT